METDRNLGGTRKLPSDRRFNACKRKVKSLGASQSLSETFPCTGYKAFYIEGEALRGNRVARIEIGAH